MPPSFNSLLSRGLHSADLLMTRTRVALVTPIIVTITEVECTGSTVFAGGTATTTCLVSDLISFSTTDLTSNSLQWMWGLLTDQDGVDTILDSRE